LSSTTDPDRESGQAVVVFTIWLFLLLVVAALAFDVGQTLLDRRHQQDAADAAALAGARYLTSTTPNYVGTCSAVPGTHTPALKACAMAVSNGYTDGVNGIVVNVKVPPGPESLFSNFPGYIEVNIGSTRSSFLHGRLLPNTWRVAAMGVATNGAEGAAPYSFIALNPTKCSSADLSGNGTIISGSNIQVNSTCSSALKTTGNATIDVLSPTGQINVVGGWQPGGNGTVDPVPNVGAPWQPDPLSELPSPTVPALPQAIVRLTGTRAIPNGCPGSATPATAAAPALCQFPSSYSGTTWRLFPGYYPGGLVFQAGTFYLEPGIYYIGGGGLTMTGNGATIYSVNAAGTAPPMGGGILLFNGEDATYHDACAGTAAFPGGVNAGLACIGAVTLNGSQASIHLQGIQTGPYKGIVYYQDRNLTTGGTDLQANGSTSNLDLVGTLYAPKGFIVVNGSGATATTVQVIADSFKVTGANGSTFSANYDGNAFFKLKGTGLVQ
jgi:hypothetical protein